MPGIQCYYAASTRTAEGMVLLHKIIKGIADGSFGLEVAALAGLPQKVLERAQEIVKELTMTAPMHPGLVPAVRAEQQVNELKTYIAQREKEYKQERRLAAELAQVDGEQITAKQALEVIWRLKQVMQ